MRRPSPRIAGLPSKPAPPGACAFLAAAMAAWLAAGCHRDPPPVAPGEPIAAPAELQLGTMESECDGVLAALAAYKRCPNLDEYDRGDLDAWTERAEQDFAAGKKAHADPAAQHAIAEACHKAMLSVTAANERCHAGPRPRP